MLVTVVNKAPVSAVAPSFVRNKGALNITFLISSRLVLEFCPQLPPGVLLGELHHLNMAFGVSGGRVQFLRWTPVRIIRGCYFSLNMFSKKDPAAVQMSGKLRTACHTQAKMGFILYVF